jgi:ribosomal-protein-alanine N-acetyltransferase
MIRLLVRAEDVSGFAQKEADGMAALATDWAEPGHALPESYGRMILAGAVERPGAHAGDAGFPGQPGTGAPAAARMSVVIRPVRRRDGARLAAANAASRDFHRPWVEPFADLAGFRAWFAQMGERKQAYLAERDGVLVGVVNVNEIVRGAFQSAYLGYWGYPGGAGGGAMTEAVGLVVAEAFGPLGLHRVEANIQPGNVRSRALVRRLGFRLEGLSPRYLRIGGEWRDHERWAKCVDD